MMATETISAGRACAKYEARLEDYLNGELSAKDAKRASQHWQNCAACRAALKHAVDSVRLLRLAGASADPGPGFARTVMERIRAAESERLAARTNYLQLFVSLGWRFAATATLALAVLVSYNAGRGHGAQPRVAAARPTDEANIFGPEPGTTPANGDEVLIMLAENGHAEF